MPTMESQVCAKRVSNPVKVNPMRMREAMITIAGVPGFGEQPRWLERVANAANISKRAARALWRGEIQSPHHRAFVAVKREAERLERERAYKAEKAALAALFHQLAGRHRATDEDFHKPQLDLLEHLARALRAED